MLRSICFGLLAVLGVFAYAQDNSTGEPTFLPPNAASFGKYGDIPINYHTGTTNIGIPIFEITEGGLSLPISLSYHSGGIRVDEMASWVGLGWSLNAGGVISRSVQGGLDEGNSKTGALTSRAPWGWYRNYGAPPEIVDYTNTCPYQYEEVDWGDEIVTSGPNINQTFPPNGTACYEYHYDAARGLIDTEPDIFSFNIGGFSGKFFFDENRTPVLLPVQDIKIDVTFNESTMKFKRWTITTPDGVKYYFGDRPSGIDAIENSYSLTWGWPDANENYYGTSSWYLYRIESPNARHWIELEYEEEIYGYASRSSHSCQVNIVGAIGGTDCDDAPIPRVRNRAEGVRLSRITTSSGRYEARFLISNSVSEKRQDVSLEIGTNTAYPLKFIEIDDNYGWCKKFEFQTSYFQSPSTIHSTANYNDESDRKRLRLDAVVESDCNNTIIKPPHTFEYNSTTMARRYSLARDHWGFYNGADTQKSLIPNESQNITSWAYAHGLPDVYVVSGSDPTQSNGGANRSPNATKMKAWSLEKINYPTGGYTQFSFEPNDHNGQMIGGLRILQVSNYDENDLLVGRKSYRYLSSQLYTQVDYGTDLQVNNPYVHNVVMGWEYGAQYSSTPNTALRHNQGYHIGYTSVVVDHEDGSSQKFVYNNSPIIFFNDYHPAKPTQLKISNGTMLRQESYDNMETIVSSTNNTYDFQNFHSDFSIVKIEPVTGYRYDPDQYGGTTPVPFTWNFKNVYNISSSAARIASVTETRDGVSQTSSYTYGGNHQQPIELTTTNSEGETITTIMRYAPDLTSTMASNLSQRNQIVPLEEKNYVDSGLISQSDYFYSGSTIMNLSHIEAYPTGTEMIRTDVNFNDSDQFQSIQKENDIPVAYYWEGDMGISVAKFSNATPDQVFYTSFEELGSGTFSTTLAKTGYYYSDGNSVDLAALGAPDPAGNLRLSYHYYANGAWQYREADFTNSTLTESGAIRLDEIRIYPKGALVESYQTGFGGQMISQTDNQGNTIRYELDALGRLRYVKDQDNYTLKEYSYNYAN